MSAVKTSFIPQSSPYVEQTEDASQVSNLITFPERRKERDGWRERESENECFGAYNVMQQVSCARSTKVETYVKRGAKDELTYLLTIRAGLI